MYLGSFDLQNINTEQNSTRQNNTEQSLKYLLNKCYLVQCLVKKKNVILIF
jgi:hypothetical protein